MRNIAVLLLILSAHAAFSQTPASLEGRVVRWGTDEPIAKASIELRRIESGPSTPFVATTTGDGAFVFSNVPAGQYRVVALRPGYVTAEYAQRWPNGAGSPLTLPPGRAVSNVSIPMLQTGAISGVVRDALGNPVGNVEVQALKASYQTGHRVLTKVQSVQSDDRGEYRLFWLTPGKYFVVAQHPDLSFSPIIGGGITIGGFARGLAPDPGVDTLFYQQFKSTGDNAAASRPNFGQVLAKEKYVAVYYPNTPDATSAAALDVGSGAEAKAIDFTLTPQTLQRIRGHVVYESNNDPALSARVQYVTSTGMPTADNDTFMGIARGATPVQFRDGAFEMALPSGSYTLVAAVNNRVARLPLSVGDRDIDDIVLAIGPVFNLKGLVTFEGHQLTAAELAALQLTVAMDPPIPGLETGDYSNVVANGVVSFQTGRGDFRIGIAPLLQIPGGSSRVSKNRPGFLADAYVKSIRLEGADLLNDGLHLDAEPKQRVDIVLSKDAGVLEGRVINSDRQPVPGVAVVLVPDATRRRRVDLMKATSSDSSGRFRVDHIPPGNYVAFALDGVEDGEWQNPDFIAAHEAAGKALTIGVDVSTAVDLVAIH